MDLGTVWIEERTREFKANGIVAEVGDILTLTEGSYEDRCSAPPVRVVKPFTPSEVWGQYLAEVKSKKFEPRYPRPSFPEWLEGAGFVEPLNRTWEWHWKD